MGQVEGPVCYPSRKVSSLMSQLPAAHWISLSLWPTELFLASHIHPQAHTHTHTYAYSHTELNTCNQAPEISATDRFKSQIARPTHTHKKRD